MIWISIGLVLLILYLAIPKKKRKTPEEPEKTPPLHEIIKAEIEREEAKISKVCQGEETFPYRLVDSVLTYKECVFYQSLLPITTKLGLTVFAKMRIADLVTVPKDNKDYMKWFNYIRSKHIDFIVCQGFKPVLLIEVDDRTHNWANRIKRDEFVDKIFVQLKLPIFHLRSWDNEELEKQIISVLTPNSKGAPPRQPFAARGDVPAPPE